MSEQAGEKTLAPTPKRKKDAAQKGQVLRSKELTTATGILVGTVWLTFAGPWLLETLAQTLRASLVWDRANLDSFQPGKMIMVALFAVLPPVLLLGTMVLGASLVSQLGFGEGRWVAKNIAPKASRLNPLSGLKRMFGPNGWIEMGKGIAKITLLAAIAYFWVTSRMDTLFTLGRGNLSAQLSYGWDAIISLLFALCAGLIIIALIDTPVQWIRLMGKLKMTHQDMRDEHKQSEGSPEQKSAIRSRQRQIAMGSLGPAMREAQFVITNPSHFAVAMTYDPQKASAPIVLAKGRGEKALAMRELAAELKVPVLEYPSLARSVYFTTRERQVIREELFAAVASVLAFVFSLKRGENPVQPHVDVPVLLRFDAEGRAAPDQTA